MMLINFSSAHSSQRIPSEIQVEINTENRCSSDKQSSVRINVVPEVSECTYLTPVE